MAARYKSSKVKKGFVLMSTRRFPFRLLSVLMQNWRGLMTSVVLMIALLLGAAHLFRDRWIELDAQQWNRWFPSTQVSAVSGENVRYKKVRYRIEKDDELGQANGRVGVETTYEFEVETGPDGYFAENGWLWRIGWALRNRPFEAATWQDLGGLFLRSYRSSEDVYQYICASQEYRWDRTRIENDVGMRATYRSYLNHSQSGWSNGLDNWVEAVNAGEAPRLIPLAPLWRQLCPREHFPAVDHFSSELNQQRDEALRSGRHRIWIPFPDRIKDPIRSYTSTAGLEWPMEVCAEEVTEGRLSCRAWLTGEDTSRHALLLGPGTYRFFQKYYDKLPERFCGPASPCGDTTRWYWRTRTRGPVQITLKDQEPGTRVGPQIGFFDVEESEDDFTWTWPAPRNVAGPEFGPTSRKKWLTVAGKRGDLIVASAEGRVVSAGPGPRGYGNVIILLHTGYSDYQTRYAHLQDLLVKEGQTVKSGQKIATMGSTGTDRVQLYFEIHRDYTRMSPADYLNGR